MRGKCCFCSYKVIKQCINLSTVSCLSEEPGRKRSVQCIHLLILLCCHLSEGGCPVQDLVSSPSSLPSAMEVRNTNILQYQPVPPQVIPVESRPLTGVVHNPMSPTRPQAQVQSIQFSGQPALTGML